MRLRHGESREGTRAGQSLGRAMKNPETEGTAKGRLGAARRGESGQTTVVMTLFLATFLMGFIAVGIDVESLFQAKRQAQAAADAAAIAAAEEYPNTTNEQTAAWGVAALNGFDHLAPVNPAIVNVNQTPSSGNYVSGSTPGEFIEVVVSRPIRTFFGGILTHKTTMVVAARAVAAHGQGSPTCVCLEGTSGTDLTMNNGSTLNPTGCGTTINSNSSSAATIYGGATLDGTSIGSVSSNWDTPINVHDNGAGQGISAGTKVVQGIPSGCSPPVPTVPAASTYTAANCMDDPSLSGSKVHIPWNGYTFSVGPTSTYSIAQPNDSDGVGVACYTSLLVGAQGNVETVLPGVYIIKNGTLHFYGNGNQGGNGVTFYLVGTANLLIDNGAQVNLVAPLTGTYAGITILQDPADTQPISIQGGGNVSFSGAVFAPSSDITLGNGSGTSVGADIVAKTLLMNGGGTLNSTPKANLGSFDISTAKLTE
jgi:Putative Flp pilus-assembly TadE/G-like